MKDVSITALCKSLVSRCRMLKPAGGMQRARHLSRAAEGSLSLDVVVLLMQTHLELYMTYVALREVQIAD